MNHYKSQQVTTSHHKSLSVTGILYVIGTPIGNLEDITLRALRILKEVDLIICEDTRHSRILFDRYEIKTPYTSYHQHSRIIKTDFILNELKTGKNVAMISDAGTPGISDPGGVLVEKAVKNGIDVIPIPGPNALIACLSVCGFSADQFLFLGYLPKKKGRQTLLRNITETMNFKLYQSIVFYESPYRIIKSFEDFHLSLGDMEVVVGRELTKKFEEIFRGKLSEAIEHFKMSKPLGEFAVVVKIK